MRDTQNRYKKISYKKIPKDWDVVKIGDQIVLEYGKGLTKKERVHGIYPVYGSNGIVGYHSDFLIKGPGIIVGRKGTIGAINWSNNHFWPIDTTYYVKPINKNTLNLRWLYYKLISLNLSRLNMATGTPGLNRNLVYSILIPLPPLPEQKKIAEILSTVDEAIEKTDKAIEKTERLKKGLMQKLLTDGWRRKDEEGREYKQTEIGRIPKEWEVVKLGNVIKFKNGDRPEFSEKGEYKVYGANGVMGLSNKFLIDKKYTLIIGRVGASGKIHLTSEKIWVSDNAIYSKDYDKDKIEMNFIYYLLKFKDLRKLATISTHPIITQSQINDIQLPLPPLPEQKKIAEILSTVDKKLELLRKRKERYKQIKKGLMNDLLTGRKRAWRTENEG